METAALVVDYYTQEHQQFFAQPQMKPKPKPRSNLTRISKDPKTKKIETYFNKV